jgi:ABC-type transport system substrate-binding protein
MDPAKRAELYQNIQRIFQERGPIILTFFLNNLWGASAQLDGIQPTMGLGTALDLRYVYFKK